LATSRRFVTLSWLAVGLLAAFTGAGMRPAHAQIRFNADYTVTLLGLPIGHGSWTVDVEDTRFSGEADGTTAGLLRFFANGHGRAKAEGGISARQPIAELFKASIDAGHSSDDLKIIFSGGKAKEYLAHPQPPNPNVVPLTDASRTGAFDPMTALMISVSGSGDTVVPAACKRKIAVFDGHMRFDLELAFKRQETVKAAGYQGPAVVCAVYFTPVAGYDPGRSAIKYLTAQRGMEIWLAPLNGTRLLVPFKMAVPTPVGLGVLQATRFVATPREHAAALNSN
jgi:hypothetical protein